MFREAITNVWDAAESEPQAAEEHATRRPFRRSRLGPDQGGLKKSFYRPVIEIVGWVERNKVPGWAARTPTVLPPEAPPILPAPSAPAPATPAVKKPAKAKKGRGKARAR